MAEWTGLEPATLDVTGRYSNQLNYHSMTQKPLGSFRLKLVFYRFFQVLQERCCFCEPHCISEKAHFTEKIVRVKRRMKKFLMFLKIPWEINAALFFDDAMHTPGLHVCIDYVALFRFAG